MSAKLHLIIVFLLICYLLEHVNNCMNAFLIRNLATHATPTYLLRWKLHQLLDDITSFLYNVHLELVDSKVDVIALEGS